MPFPSRGLHITQSNSFDKDRTPLFRRNDRQDHVARAHGIVVDRLVRFDLSAVQSEGFAGVRIDIKTREVAAGDIDPDTVAFLEDVGRWERFDQELIGLAGLHELLLLRRVPVPCPKDAIGDVHLIP